MMLPGSRGQQVRDFLYDMSGTITIGGTAQLILPEQPNRAHLFIQNISSGLLTIEAGGARAAATLTGNALTSIAVTNGGFGYTIPPRVHFYGGGDIAKNPTYLCPGLPGNIMPGKVPSARALLTAGAVSSIVIDNPGASNFTKAPLVFLQSSEQDPYGAASPSATVGIQLSAGGGSIFFNGTTLTTDAISIFGATTGQAYVCKYLIGG